VNHTLQPVKGKQGSAFSEWISGDGPFCLEVFVETDGPHSPGKVHFSIALAHLASSVELYTLVNKQYGKKLAITNYDSLIFN